MQKGTLVNSTTHTQKI